MFHRRIGSLVAAVVLVGALAGCSGAPAGGVGELGEAIAPSLDSFVLRLPRIYVQYVETGEGYAEPALFGVRASMIEPWIGMDLSMVKIPTFYMDWIKASDLQHIEVVNSGKGFFGYTNGKPTPYLAWDAESVGLAAQLVEGLGVPNGAVIGRLLPLLRHVGLDIIVQMPLQDGAEVIPYRDPEAGLMETTAAPEVEEPEAEVKLQVAFDERGVLHVAGLSADVLQPFMGYTPALHPLYVAQVNQAGIQSLALQMRGDGLFIFVNDQPLPNVAWSKEHLTNAVDLYAQMNEASWVPNEAFVGMVREMVQQVGNADVQVVVDFP